MAQHKRVLGCVLVTTKKSGGRDVSRLALWRANATQEQKLHCGCYSFAGAGHRGEYGDLSVARRCATARVAGQSAAGTGRGSPCRYERGAGTDWPPDISYKSDL